MIVTSDGFKKIENNDKTSILLPESQSNNACVINDNIDKTIEKLNEKQKTISLDVTGSGNVIGDIEFDGSKITVQKTNVSSGSTLSKVDSGSGNAVTSIDLTDGTMTVNKDVTFLKDSDISSWAKQANKPSYIASEVGALPNTTTIPNKTSDLTNDSNFVVDENYVHTDNNYDNNEKHSNKEDLDKLGHNENNKLTYNGSVVGGGSGITDLPSGGTTGQVLAKTSNADSDVEWKSIMSDVSETDTFQLDSIDSILTLDFKNASITSIPDANGSNLTAQLTGMTEEDIGENGIKFTNGKYAVINSTLNKTGSIVIKISGFNPSTSSTTYNRIVRFNNDVPSLFYDRSKSVWTYKTNPKTDTNKYIRFNDDINDLICIITWDIDNKESKIYFDGKLKYSSTYGEPIQSTSIQIGESTTSGYWAYFTLKRFELYSKALNSEEALAVSSGTNIGMKIKKINEGYPVTLQEAVYVTPTISLKNKLYGLFVNVMEYVKDSNGILDASVGIQKALDKIKDGGILLIPDGTYKLNSSVKFYSNQRIIMGKKTKLIRGLSSMDNMIINYNDGSTGGYEMTENVEIIGGVIDANEEFTSNITALSFAHCKNIKLQGITFINHRGTWHTVEVNSSNHVIIDNCIFEKTNTSSTNSECIQLDYAHQQSFYPWTCLYDDTVCEDITIQNCMFGESSISPAIGNHSDAQHLNIVIDRCSFYNRSSSRGVLAFVPSCKYIKITNNTFNNCLTTVLITDGTACMMCNTFNNVTNKYTGENIINYDEVFQSSNDAQLAYETAIIGKGGSVSKAGSIPTKTEIINAINTIP